MAELNLQVGNKPAGDMPAPEAKEDLRKPGFNHDEHMAKMKDGINQAISILQGLLSEEETEAQAEGEESAPDSKGAAIENFAKRMSKE